MILKVHVRGALPYDIGDEIWHGSLREAIKAEAETIAAYAGADLLGPPDRDYRERPPRSTRPRHDVRAGRASATTTACPTAFCTR